MELLYMCNFLSQLELLGISAPLYNEYLHICIFRSCFRHVIIWISRPCHKYVTICNCLFQLAIMGTYAHLYTKYPHMYI